MKLNPFSKKTNGYFDSIKAKHATASRELADIQQELDDAQAVLDHELKFRCSKNAVSI